MPSSVLPRCTPVRLRHDLALPLLQEYDVACDIGSCAVPERRIGEADCARAAPPVPQGTSLPQGRLVKRSLACDERHNAARSDLIQRLCEKVIMDTEIVLCVLRFIELVVPERHVAHSNIEKVYRGTVFLQIPLPLSVLLGTAALRSAR